MRSSFNWKIGRAILLITLIVSILSILLIISGSVGAAYWGNRPIAIATYGPVNQFYLYGETNPDNGIDIHKGIDFSVPTGESVHAIADGVVVNERQDIQDGTNPYDWGNFVLIRHNQQQYDRASGQNGYVYSLYMHLKQASLQVVTGTQVVAGQIIAQSDNTGHSSNPHFHLQIDVSKYFTATLNPNTLGSEVNTRNPELWLSPYNGNTGTIVGKVTHLNGTDWVSVTVSGPQKQAAWQYATSLTYRSVYNINPDDILVENWGTTDVTPGHYHITTSVGGDLGWYDVVAGQVTYAGLFPVWLPYVRNNSSGWHTTITVRNNSSTCQAQVNTTFFNRGGTVSQQRTTDYIPPHAVAILTAPSGFDGSAMVVSSEDVTVVVREENGGELNEYNGIMASTNISASLGWERAGTLLYVPRIKNTYSGRSSRILVANAGPAAATGNIQFYAANGSQSSASLNLAVNGSDSIQPPSNLCTNSTGACSVQISSSQPLAVVVREQEDVSTNNRATFNAFSAGATTNYAPLVKNNWGGHTTTLAVQNVGAAATNVSVTCYDSLSSATYSCGTQNNLASYATVVFNMASFLPDNFIGSAVVSSSGQPFATLIYEAGTPYKLMTNAPLAGSVTAYAPELYGTYVQSGQTWTSGIYVQNTGSADATITVTYYNADGSSAGQWSSTASPNRMARFSCGTSNLPCPNFAGSAVIQADQTIVAVVNTSHTGSGDTKASYTVPNR